MEFSLIEICRYFHALVARQLLPLAILLLLQACATVDQQRDRKDSEVLSLNFLQGDLTLESPLPTRYFSPPDNLRPPSNSFEGVLTLQTVGAVNQMEVVTDTFGVVDNEKWGINKLPPFSVAYITDGSDLIPLVRGPQRSEHPYWELVAQPGKIWDDPRDDGWSRAALPFSLKETNQNCTHNGMMTFLFRSDGMISRVAWQVTSETCIYLKLDLWGTANAEYVQQPAYRSAEIAEAYRLEVSRRLPVRPLSNLTLDHPGFDLVNFQPPGFNDASVYGLVVDGINYRSECPTRYGPYPFCAVLSLPSYSLAKSLVGSLAYQLMINRWAEFAVTPVSELIPECNTEDGRWDDVTPSDLLNMVTGNYDSAVNNADENAVKMGTFFLAKSHADKVRFSCSAWPRKSTPGSQWVYHTSDTYLLGIAMNIFLKQKLAPQSDIYRDLLYPQVYEPLGLSPAMKWMQRTYDEVAQPFTGYGLMLHADDALRLALALNLNQRSNEQAADTISDKPKLPSGFVANTMPGAYGSAYKDGFWGADASSWLACSKPPWIPFMVGYGGIIIAIFPNGGVYYHFTDSDQYDFRKAAIEANKVLNYCKE